MKIVKTTAFALTVSLGVIGAALAQAPNLSDPAVKDYTDGQRYTGFVISDDTTREMQLDEIQNPSMMWVDHGEAIWSRVEGESGKSCASCHQEPASMAGKSVTYPKVSKADGKLVTLEHQINKCRTTRLKAPAWDWESDDMLGLSALIRMQSKGMPIQVKTDGEAAPYYAQGKAFYEQRRGALDMACVHCHVNNHGNNVRSETLSQGMPNGFPTYRLKWQKLGSLHRRFRGCNKNIRAEPYKQGSPEYTALELYVMSRANGLPVESPSVRK